MSDIKKPDCHGCEHGESYNMGGFCKYEPNYKYESFYESFEDWCFTATCRHITPQQLLREAFEAARETTTKPVTQTNDKH